MMEVNRRLLKTLKRDPPAQFPSSIALTMTTTGGWAQIRVQHRPSMTKDGISMMERSITRKTYVQTPSNNANSTTHDPHQVQPLEEPPEESIPAKPPYFNCPNQFMIWPTTYGQFMPQLNWRSNLRTLPTNILRDTTSMSALQRGEVTSLNGPIITDRQKGWEQLRTFHASNKQWPMGTTSDGTEGGSPLVWTMLQSFATARLLTYAWFEHCSTPTRIDCPISLSQAKWNQ